MSLKKFAQKLNLESENTSFVDEEVVMPSIEERLDAEEAEAELVEVLDEVEEHQEALEESEEAEAEIDEHIEEAEATIAEAEGALGDDAGEATKEGDEGSASEPSEDTDGGEVDPEDVAEANDDEDDEDKSVLDENGDLPVEEVVAAQEALKSVLKRTGYTLPNRIQVSREDIRNNPLEAYKMNLEDWKELKNTVSEGAKKIWEQIKKAYRWVVEQFKKVFGSKETKLKLILKDLNQTSGNPNPDPKYKEEFVNKYGERFSGVGSLINDPKDIVELEKLIKYCADGILAFVKAPGKTPEEKLSNTKKIPGVALSFTYAPLAEAVKKAGEEIKFIKVTGGEIAVGGANVETVSGDKLKNLKFNKGTYLKYATNYISIARNIERHMNAINNAVDRGDENMISKAFIKRSLNGSLKTFTSFNNDIYKFILVMGKALIVASKGDKPKGDDTKK